MSRNYPKIKFIGQTALHLPRYKCDFCNKRRVNKRVDIQVDDQSENDEIFFFHSDCLAGLSEVQILAKLYPEHYATLQENRP
jgi:hypothetical protein